MKYFIDFEFIEGFHKPLFGKRRHHIDMISIGIVAEDGREFYAISNQYDYADADKWVKENVIEPMYMQEIHGDIRNRLDVHNFHKHVGKHPMTIGLDVRNFCGGSLLKEFAAKDIEFYGYYADYDWVVFCSMFGRMIDLPKGFPMYCKDLKQMLDEKVSTHQLTLETLKTRSDYPKQQDAHNALSDAKWNKELYNFIQKL